MATALTLLAAALAVAPWVLVLCQRVGALGAAAVVSLAVPALVLALLFATHATGLGIGAGVLGLLAIAGGAGWALVVRRPSIRVRAGAWREAWPAFVGAGIAASTFALALVVPGASRLAWSMLGDSASQLTEARLIYAAGGLEPPPLNNPVPLTPALVTATAAVGRPTSGARELFVHDLTAYAGTWATLIVAAALLAGVVAHGIVRAAGTLAGWAARLAVAGTSVLPLGWFWTGYPVKFGFINAHVSLVLLLAAVASYLAFVRRPWTGLVLQALAAVLLVLTWSPLAIFPAALGVAHGLVAARGWRELSVRVRVALVAGVIVVAPVAALFAYPLVRDARSSLTIAGGLAEFPKPMLAATVIVLLGALGLTPLRRDRTGLGLAGIGVGALVGQAGILALAGQLTGPWTYYPHKYAWLATAVVLTTAVPVALVAATGMRATWLRWGARGGVALVIAVSLGLGSWWAPDQAAFLRNSLPVVILVEDDLPDEGHAPSAVPDAVAERADAQTLTIPWRSDLANDYRAAFWLIHLERERAILRGDDAAASELWMLANFHEEAEEVCRLARVAGGLVVETSDADAAAWLAGTCDADVEVVVGAVGR